MPTITVRDLNPRTQIAIKHRAVDNHRSFEAEVRAILDEAARTQAPTAADRLFDAAGEFRAATRGCDLALAERPATDVRELFS